MHAFWIQAGVFMSERSSYGVILFRSVQGALAAERILIQAAISHKLIPVPRHLSSDCGFCLRFDWQHREALTELLGSGSLGIQGIERL